MMPHVLLACLFLASGRLSLAAPGLMQKILSKTFDYGTPVLALVDMGSDIAIAHEYYEDAIENDTPLVFFTIAAFLIGVSSMAGTIYSIKFFLDRHEGFFDDLGCFKVVALVFLFFSLLPFGQLLLIATWVYMSVWGERGLAPELPPPPPPPPQLPSRRATTMMIDDFHNEYQEWIRTHLLPYRAAEQRYFKYLVGEQISKHMPFVIECCTESAPQSLLQVSEIVVKQQRGTVAVSGLQYFSLALSICSIISKVYTACQSMVQQVFWLKFWCLSFDVSCLFYTFAALWRVGPEDVDDVPVVFFLSRPVDVASGYYLYCLTFLMVPFLLICLCHLFPEFIHDIAEVRDKRGLCVLSCCGVVMGAVPMALLLLGARLSYFVFWLKAVEASWEDNEEFFTKAFAFYMDGSDRTERMRALNHALAEAGHHSVRLGDQITCPMGNGVVILGPVTSSHDMIYRTADGSYKCCELSKVNRVDHVLMVGDRVLVDGRVGVVTVCSGEPPFAVRFSDGTERNDVYTAVRIEQASTCCPSHFMGTIVTQVLHSNLFSSAAIVLFFSSDSIELVLCDDCHCYRMCLSLAYGLVFFLMTIFLVFTTFYPVVSLALELQQGRDANTRPSLFRYSLFAFSAVLFLAAVVYYIYFGRHFGSFVRGLTFVRSSVEANNLLGNAQRLYKEQQTSKTTNALRDGPLPAVFGASSGSRGEDTAWTQKVKELAERGLELGKLLDFYTRLGRDLMPHYDPEISTTSDVVRQAIIPATWQVGSDGTAYATMVQTDGSVLASRMVSHNWANKFAHLVAAIVADALEIPMYGEIVARLSPEALPSLISELGNKGALSVVYWVCAFSVNQHGCICAGYGPEPPPGTPAYTEWDDKRRDAITGDLYPLCECVTEKHFNDKPASCEMNKFDDMMRYLAQHGSGVRQLLAVDDDFDIFSRAWVVAELIVARDLGLPQRMKTYNAASLKKFKRLSGKIRIEKCRATRPEDVQLILAKVDNITQFNREVNALIFKRTVGLLAQLQTDVSQGLHVGTQGVDALHVFGQLARVAV